jgi:L-aspartate oxidase
MPSEERHTPSAHSRRVLVTSANILGAVRERAIHRTDVLVVGAGLSGLYASLEAAARGARVTLVTKGSLESSNSFMAQGGIAAAVAADDDPALHHADTIAVGRGLADPAAAEVLVRDGIRRVADLERLGVAWDRDEAGRPQLAREGGHGRHRIFHADGAATGAAIARTLIARVLAEPLVQVLDHTAAIGLLSDGEACAGAWVLGHDELLAVRARMTLLATGGACALYSRTTNPAGATGDGIAVAHRAGAQVRHMEFVQFHPTAVATGSRAFLISEAVRGEGAHLVSGAGERFMPAEHPDAELAPRDVVTRVIQARLEAGETSHLSLRHLDARLVRERFPSLVEGCARLGFDLCTDLVPVAPAAHYLMGGIATDLDGATTLAGLHASGESACTGAHGANRLASNSLLECFVFAHRAVAAGLAAAEPQIADVPPPARPLVRARLPELRRRMWAGAGPVRDEPGLGQLLGWLDGEPESNPVRVATLIAAAALDRRESRGGHLRRDFPDLDPALEAAMPCAAASSTT